MRCSNAVTAIEEMVWHRDQAGDRRVGPPAGLPLRSVGKSLLDDLEQFRRADRFENNLVAIHYPIRERECVSGDDQRLRAILSRLIGDRHAGPIREHCVREDQIIAAAVESIASPSDVSVVSTS
jgi:hypothetical protein